MDATKCILILSLVLLSWTVFPVRGGIYISSLSSVVSQGTRTNINCYNDGELSDPNIFTTGGKVEWCRTTPYSSSLERVAQWTREDGSEILLSDPEGRFSLEGGLMNNNVFSINLKIRNTSKADQGTYTCLLYRGDNTKAGESAPYSLTVKYTPAEYYPLCTATPNALGNRITLKCQSEKTTPAVSIQWFKNNGKVADGIQLGQRKESTYVATTDELDGQFECRLHYTDEPDITVTRSCRFSKPYLVILRARDQGTEDGVYHAFAHANPPFVSDINCFLDTTASTPFNFRSEFSGYGVATVGPLMPADNGSHLICRAKNVFGWGQTRMAVYSFSDGTQGETTIPSVVTNYMPNSSTLSVVISPRDPTVIRGGNATFSCSYSLTVHTPAQADVVIRWKYDGVLVTRSTPKLKLAENSLQVIDVSDVDDGVRVTCVASMMVDETRVVNIPPGESTTEIHVTSGPLDCHIDGSCLPELLHSSEESSIFRNPSFAIGISIVAVAACLVIVVLIFLIAAQHKKRSRARGESGYNIMTPQMTFRAGNGSLSNGRAPGGDQMTNPATNPVRALPAHPPTNDSSVDPVGKPRGNLHVVMPMEASKPEMAYQEMVGNTGVTKARNGNPALPINDNVRGPPVMVPAPHGGFVPQTMANNDNFNGKKNCQEGGDTNYEDLDCMRQQHVPRATGNDYQTSISNTPFPREELEPLGHYANS